MLAGERGRRRAAAAAARGRWWSNETSALTAYGVSRRRWVRGPGAFALLPVSAM